MLLSSNKRKEIQHITFLTINAHPFKNNKK